MKIFSILLFPILLLSLISMVITSGCTALFNGYLWDFLNILSNFAHSFLFPMVTLIFFLMHIFIEWKNKKHTKEKIRYGAVLSILLIFLFLRGVGIVASSTYDSCTGGRLTIDQIPGVNPFDKEPLTQVEQEKKEYVESLGERITLRYSSQGIESDSSLGEKRIITSGHVLKKPNSWNNGSVKDASGLEYYKFEPSQRLGLIEEDRILIGKKCFDNIHLCSTIYLNGAAVNISTESDNQNILDHYYKMIEFDEKQPLRSTSVDYY